MTPVSVLGFDCALDPIAYILAANANTRADLKSTFLTCIAVPPLRWILLLVLALACLA